MRFGPTGCATLGATASILPPGALYRRRRTRRPRRDRLSGRRRRLAVRTTAGASGKERNRPDLGGLNSTSPAIFPIHEYGHTDGNISITGGYVYRGDEIEGLDGTYFFGDFGSGRVWSFRYDGTTKTEFQQRNAELVPNVGTLNHISSFGEDADGELYIVDLDGEIFKIGSRIYGDANNDLLVDGADYTVWADNFLKTGIGIQPGRLQPRRHRRRCRLCALV